MRQSFVVENFVEEVAPVVAVEEEDLEIVLLLEGRLLVENLPELKLLEFLIELDVLSD